MRQYPSPAEPRGLGIAWPPSPELTKWLVALVEFAEAAAEATPRGSDADASSEGSDTETDRPADERWRVVGTKTFVYDEQFLEDYLTSVMQYWRGERLPRGVNIALTRRCR